MELSVALRLLFDDAVAATRASPREARDALDRAMAAAGFPAHVLTPPGARYVVPWRERLVLRFEELDETQRAVVAFLLEHPELPLGRQPLPGAHWALREWAGVEPPSALFAPGPDGRTPYEVLRATRGAERERLEYLARLPLRARAEVLGLLCFLPADLADEPNALWQLVAHIDGSLGDWAVATARRILADRRAPRQSEGESLAATTAAVTLQPGEAREYAAHDTSSLILPTYLALARAGRADEPAFDALLPMSRWVAASLRLECLGAVPEARREAAIMASLANERFVGDAVMGAQQLLADHPYPRLAEFLLERSFESPRPSQAIACVRDAAKKHRALERVYAAFDAALGPVRQLDGRCEPAPAWETLGEIHREQLRVLSEVWYRRGETAQQLLAPHEDSPMQLEWVRLFERDVPAFDAWLNEAWEGLVFTAGTATSAAHVGQYGVECEDRALLVALRDAFAAENLRAPG